VNDGFCHQTGYSREEVLSNTPSDINLYANPGERERFIGILQKDGKAENVVVSFRRKNGEVYYSEFSAKPIFYAGEECLLAQSRDITDRKIQESGLSFQAMLLDQIQDFVTATDLDGKIIYINEASCKAIGKARDEILGLSVESFGENPEKGATQQQIIEKNEGAGGMAWGSCQRCSGRIGIDH